MAISETTVKVDRRYLRNKTKDELIVLILQLMEIGAKKDVEIQRLRDELLVRKAFDAKKTIEIKRLKRVVTAARAANIWLFRARNDDGRAKVACDLNAALIGLDEETQDLTTTDSDE